MIQLLEHVLLFVLLFKDLSLDVRKMMKKTEQKVTTISNGTRNCSLKLFFNDYTKNVFF